MRTIYNNTCRPITSYYGGKGSQLDWLPGFLPTSAAAYVEVFSGSAAVGLARPSCDTEIFNDADPAIANLYRVLQTNAEELRLGAYFTLHSRREHAQCVQAARLHDPNSPIDRVEWARRHLVLIRQSFASQFAGSWGYSREAGSNAFPSIVDLIPPAAHRLQNATVENMHFADLIAKYDFGGEGLWYMDPPYVPETRVAKRVYHCEMTVEEHKQLLGLIRGMSDMVVLSGYRSALYDTALEGWLRVEHDVAVLASNVSARSGTGSKPRRTECLWINQAAQKRLRKEGRL
jgi:DNA adenine methylase